MSSIQVSASDYDNKGHPEITGLELKHVFFHFRESVIVKISFGHNLIELSVVKTPIFSAAHLSAKRV